MIGTNVTNKIERVPRMKIIFMFLAAASLLAVGASGEPLHFQSSAKQVSLLELYTSEGCSSCPPAETWLNRLKDSPGLWQTFVPVAFHVDYWNSLGWTDRWSAPEFSERQRAYAQLWRSQNIYTPEFVLNGQEWGTSFGLRGTPSASGVAAGVLEINSTNALRWNVRFVPATATNGSYEIHAALLAGGISSDVKAGENRGRTLPHEFAVVELVQLGVTTSNGVVHGKFILNPARHSSEKILAVAAWVTRAGELTPVQATGGWLAAPAK